VDDGVVGELRRDQPGVGERAAVDPLGVAAVEEDARVASGIGTPGKLAAAS
jgi:hypothetical protein